ncbi:MAG: TonB-dependent receptor, partial [Proteobacteria bacterium]|nr:TonB-dependent receptor [Pseudomonadota bacterium]
AVFATEVLETLPGINIARNGAFGGVASIRQRGQSNDKTLVLIDGVPANDPSQPSGGFDLSSFELADIERIEVLKGAAAAALYGSKANSGVIQIFTRRDRDGINPRASVTVGSHDHREASAGIGGGNGQAWFGIDAAYQRTDGIDACDVATPTPFSGGCFISAPEPDRDGYRSRSVSLRGGIEASDTLALDLHALRAEGETQFDGDFTNGSETVQQVIGGSSTWTPSDRIRLQLAAGRNVDASDNFKDQAFLGYFDTDRDSATLQGDFGLAPDQLLTLGLDWLRDRVDSTTTYAETERSNRAAFAQYQGRFATQSLQLALRVDDNDQFGDATTGSAAWGIELTDAWRVSAGYGTAFKAPTFNELYFPFFGNAALRPEESRTWEAGLAWRGERASWRLDGFDTEVDDLIAYDASLFLPNNIERARLRGAELGLDAELAQWTIAASVSVLDTENLIGFNAGNQLPRRARQSARVELDRAFGTLRVGLTGVAEGSRFDDVANTRRLAGYATLDLRAEYVLAPAWTLQARLANVLDRDYETASFYNQPGREWFLSLRYAPAD